MVLFWFYFLIGLIALPPFFRLLKRLQHSSISFTGDTPFIYSLINFLKQIHPVDESNPDNESVNGRITLSSLKTPYIVPTSMYPLISLFRLQTQQISKPLTATPLTYSSLISMSSSGPIKGPQEDADEFLSFILSHLSDELVLMDENLTEKQHGGSGGSSNIKGSEGSNIKGSSGSGGSSSEGSNIKGSSGSGEIEKSKSSKRRKRNKKKEKVVNNENVEEEEDDNDENGSLGKGGGGNDDDDEGWQISTSKSRKSSSVGSQGAYITVHKQERSLITELFGGFFASKVEVCVSVALLIYLFI
jgi:hypothetical protein